MRLRRPQGLVALLLRLTRPRLGVFALLFVFLAGAALAGGYSALANDVVADGGVATAAVDSTSAGDESTTSVSTDSTVVETSSEPAPTTTEPATSTEDSGSTDETVSQPPPPPPADGGSDGAPSGDTEPGTQPAPGPVLAPKHHRVHRAPETHEGGSAIVWLHRVLPDPTPPAQRLSPSFARQLRAAAQDAGVRWSLMLAVLRARGHDGRVPASRARLDRLAGRLAHSKAAVIGRGEFAKQVRALARYNRAVGLRSLVHGLQKAKARLERRILRDAHIAIYPGGRVDIALGHVDVRVIVLIRYLRVTFRDVTVTSLVSGHRYYARPGVVSAHMYGLAADIAALGGVPITGHQQPGGLTEKGVEAILRLPAEVQPQQVISLLGLGGPSFPLADHYDHIHVGF
jgi:hypothetical protein